MLVLVPAGVLVLVLLGALAVDSAVAYQAQLQLHDQLAAAAVDAVDAGLDQHAFYGTGEVRFDPAAVAQTVCRSVAAQGGSDLHQVRIEAAISGRSLQLTGTATVRTVFGGALHGFGTRSIRASADAVLEGPPGAAPGPAGAGGPVEGGAPVPLACGS